MRRRLKDDIRRPHDGLRRFAETQKATTTEMEVEPTPGPAAGRKALAVQAAGRFAPGGGHFRVASALAKAATAKVAGRARRRPPARSPPRPAPAWRSIPRPEFRPDRRSVTAVASRVLSHELRERGGLLSVRVKTPGSRRTG